MVDESNSVSEALSVGTGYATYTVNRSRPVRAIQNTTGGDLFLKLGGGNGEIKIPDYGFYEPRLAIISSFDHKSDVAGTAVLIF